MKHLPMVSIKLVRETPIRYAGATAMRGSADAFNLFKGLAEDLDREGFWIACLDTKNKLTCLSQISLGSLNQCIVHPREVFKVALLANASSIILMHNHPSGDPSPSPEDDAVTRRLSQAGAILGINVLDHIIIGDGRFYSFKDEGRIS